MFSLQLETEGRYYIVALVCLDWNQTLNNYITCKVRLSILLQFSACIYVVQLQASAFGLEEDCLKHARQNLISSIKAVTKSQFVNRN